MISQKEIREIAEGILDFLKKKKLEGELPRVIDYLAKKEELNAGFIYSPKDLSSGEKSSAEKLLTKLAGEAPGKINFLKDGNLVDGLKLSYKDKMWDLSLKGQIARINK